jgi:hypothetical protein
MQAKKDNAKMKKDIGKWYDIHKIPSHKTIDYFSKKSLVVEVKAFESDACSEYDL